MNPSVVKRNTGVLRHSPREGIILVLFAFQFSDREKGLEKYWYYVEDHAFCHGLAHATNEVLPLLRSRICWLRNQILVEVSDMKRVSASDQSSNLFSLARHVDHVDGIELEVKEQTDKGQVPFVLLLISREPVLKVLDQSIMSCRDSASVAILPLDGK
jgi:hypothetical protein